MKGLIAKKVGMTQVFDESGNLTPVTVIRVEPNVVVATQTKENCGYDAVVLGLEDLKASIKSFSVTSSILVSEYSFSIFRTIIISFLYDFINKFS